MDVAVLSSRPSGRGSAVPSPVRDLGLCRRRLVGASVVDVIGAQPEGLMR
jgi:hypothetical protein